MWLVMGSFFCDRSGEVPFQVAKALSTSKAIPNSRPKPDLLSSFMQRLLGSFTSLAGARLPEWHVLCRKRLLRKTREFSDLRGPVVFVCRTPLFACAFDCAKTNSSRSQRESKQ